ncbi:MAG: glucosaminidase domain-containing protein [Bacteroidota bacterium]
MKKGIVFIGLLLSLAVQAQKEKAEAYIHTYKELAITEMMRSGVPACITLAQGILESQSGESNLAKVSNNHFGIKCKTEWTGAKTYHDDDEKGECFRVYSSVEDSYKDHSDFLKNRPNYAFLFKLDPTDYEGWATGLKKAGYATSPTYPQKLLKVIHDYNLQQYSLDAIARLQSPAATQPLVNTTTAIVPEPVAKQPETVLPTPDDRIIKEAAAKEEPIATEVTAAVKVKKTNNYPAGIFSINHTRVMYALEGVSLLSLANQYDIPLSRLIEFNELKEMDVLDTDRLLFIERKPKKGASDFHVVVEGESLYDISQLEGVRLESLLEYNHLSKGTAPVKGNKLFLRNAATTASLPHSPK